MSVLHTVGVDPGLVHTGLVRLILNKEDRSITTSHALVQGLDADTVARWVGLPKLDAPEADVYVERYMPRRNYDSDERMVQGEAALKRALPSASFLRNTGVKKVVHPAVLQVLGMWKFPTPSHHQDLRAAARIAVLGMMFEEAGNQILSDVVRASIDGNPWAVVDEGGGMYGP